MSQRLNAEEYKRKLEHQIYLAQEHPARIYDLTDCNLNQIPRGVFTFCKVLRKYSLNLSENNINSLESGGNLDDLNLLGELIITRNKLKSLPPSFAKLSNLQKLIMDDNKLVKFPIVLFELTNLKVLSLEGNLIKVIPKEIGSLKSLRSFNILRNPITILHSEICNIETLEEFFVEIRNIKNIPPDVLSEGIDNVWKHFCKEQKREIININFIKTCSDGKLEKTGKDTASNKISYSYFSQPNQCNTRYQEIDEEVLEHERKLLILELEDKRKSLDLIKKKSELEDEAIKAILVKKKHETDRLYDRVKYAELSSNELIESIFDYNNKSRKREEFESKINSQASSYNVTLTEDEKYDVLNSMQRTIKRAAEVYSRNKDIKETQFYSDLHNFGCSNIQALACADQLQESDQHKLAFQQFQLEKDPQTKRLRDSICLIELKLQQLSVEEMNDLGSNKCDPKSRSNLMSLLHKLREELNERKLELDSKINSMDLERDKSKNDFWIIEYQKLLDEKAKSDNEIEELLKLAKFEKWTTNFKTNDFTFDSLLNISEADLIKMNLGNDLERKQFLTFLSDWKFDPIKSNTKSAPSAPFDEHGSLEKFPGQSFPSAPLLAQTLLDESLSNDETSVVLARKETECCICLNFEARILLLNCGHVCCCKKCSLLVKECPLCRQNIVQRVNLEF